MAALESILNKLSEGQERTRKAFRPYNEALTRDVLGPIDKAASLLDMLTVVQPYNMAKTILSGESQIPEKERAFGSPFSGSKDAMWETLISPQGMGALYPTYTAGETAGRYLLERNPRLQRAATRSGQLGKGALKAILSGGDKAITMLERAGPSALRAAAAPATIPLSALAYILSSSPAGAGSDIIPSRYKEGTLNYDMPEGWSLPRRARQPLF